MSAITTYGYRYVMSISHVLVRYYSLYISHRYTLYEYDSCSNMFKAFIMICILFELVVVSHLNASSHQPYSLYIYISYTERETIITISVSFPMRWIYRHQTLDVATFPPPSSSCRCQNKKPKVLSGFLRGW